MLWAFFSLYLFVIVKTTGHSFLPRGVSDDDSDGGDGLFLLTLLTSHGVIR